MKNVCGAPSCFRRDLGTFGGVEMLCPVCFQAVTVEWAGVNRRRDAVRRNIDIGRRVEGVAIFVGDFQSRE